MLKALKTHVTPLKEIVKEGELKDAFGAQNPAFEKAQKKNPTGRFTHLCGELHSDSTWENIQAVVEKAMEKRLVKLNVPMQVRLYLHAHAGRDYLTIGIFEGGGATSRETIDRIWSPDTPKALSPVLPMPAPSPTTPPINPPSPLIPLKKVPSILDILQGKNRGPGGKFDGFA